MELDSISKIKEAIDEKSLTQKEKLEQKMKSIVNSLPETFSNLIEEGFLKKRIPSEYLFTSILFSMSSAVGLSVNLRALGYSNFGNLYYALVGRRGTSKTPAMDLATNALNEYDNYHYNNYQNEIRKASQNEDAEINSIIRKRIMFQNATIESVLKGHHENPLSVGIFKDEGYSFFDNMRNNSNSRDGLVWREFLLQGNTNKHLDVSRTTSASYRMDKTCPTVLVAIQDEFMKHIMSGGILESGVVDRFLFCSNFTENTELSGKFIDERTTSAFNDCIQKILSLRDTVYNSLDNSIEPIIVNCSPEADALLKNYIQELIYEQVDADNLNCGYLAKMQINVHKLIILIHVMHNSTASSEIENLIDPETVTTAIEVCDFYYQNFKYLTNFRDDRFTKLDENKIIKIGIKRGCTQDSIARLLGVNKSTISRRTKSIN